VKQQTKASNDPPHH